MLKKKNTINEFNYNISKNAIYNIYREIRECIYKYMKFLYETEYIAEANANENFSCDESLIGHKNNSQLCLIGIINNSTKDYRIETTFQIDDNNMKECITKYIPRRNNIIKVGFSAYKFLIYNNLV